MTGNDVYLDSNFIVKLYRNEQESRRARMVLGALQGEAIVSDLTDLEVLTVLNRNLDPAQFAQASTKYKAQRSSGLYGYVAFDSQVFAQAMHIAERYAKAYSLRSLDVLHLSLSVRYQIPCIASFDNRLRTAALTLGLAVLPA